MQAFFLGDKYAFEEKMLVLSGLPDEQRVKLN